MPTVEEIHEIAELLFEQERDEEAIMVLLDFYDQGYNHPCITVNESMEGEYG